MGRTLDDVGAGGGGGLYLNADAKREVYDAGAAFYIVDADPVVDGTDGYDDQTVFDIVFESGSSFDFMPEDADEHTIYKLAFRHTATRQKKAEKVVKALGLDDDPIGPTYLITGKSNTPGHSDWWDITAEAPEKPKARASSSRNSRSAPPARRSAPEPDDDDGI